MIRLTVQDVKPLVSRCGAVFGYPEGFKANQDEIILAWITALRDFRLDELERAVDAYIATEARGFPKPAQLRGMMLAGRPSRIETPEVADHRCPSCGGPREGMTFVKDGRKPIHPVMWRHDPRCRFAREYRDLVEFYGWEEVAPQPIAAPDRHHVPPAAA